jgi:hypothetical protein
LSPNVLKLLRSIVQLIREGGIPPEFDVFWTLEGSVFNVRSGGFLGLKAAGFSLWIPWADGSDEERDFLPPEWETKKCCAVAIF